MKLALILVELISKVLGFDRQSGEFSYIDSKRGNSIIACLPGLIRMHL